MFRCRNQLINKGFSAEGVFVGLVILATSVYWLAIAQKPFHWDTASFVIPTAKHILDSNFGDFSPLYYYTSLKPLAYAHPPLLPIMIAISWRIFGIGITQAHLVMWPFLPIYLLASYRLFRFVLPRSISMITTLLLACFPIILTEYAMIYLDLPMAAMAILALYFYLVEKQWLAGFCLMLSMWFKLPAIFLLGPLLLHSILLINYENSRNGEAQSFKELIQVVVTRNWYLLYPLLGFASWLIYFHAQSGWWLRNEALLPDLNKNWHDVVSPIFLAEGRWLLTGLGLLSGFRLHYRRLLWKVLLSKQQQVIWLGILVVITYVLAFLLLDQFVIRYAMVLYPLLLIVLIWFLYRAWGLRIAQASLLVMLFFALKNLWPTGITQDKELLGPMDLSYQDVIVIGQRAAHFVEQNYADRVVYGGYPESYQLTLPVMGYVTKPLHFKPCGDVQKEQFVPVGAIMYGHYYSGTQRACTFLLTQLPVKKLARFQSHGKWLEIYEVVGEAEF